MRAKIGKSTMPVGTVECRKIFTQMLSSLHECERYLTSGQSISQPARQFCAIY